MGMHLMLYPLDASDAAALAGSSSLEEWDRVRRLCQHHETYLGTIWDVLATVLEKLDPELPPALRGREPPFAQEEDAIGYRFVTVPDVRRLADRMQAIPLRRVIEVYDPRAVSAAYRGSPSRDTFNAALGAWKRLVPFYQAAAQSAQAALIYIG